MAVRNLTDVFVLMRNNAMQTRHIYADQDLDDRALLVKTSSGSASVSLNRNRPALPPDWVDGVEEVKGQLPLIRKRMKDLAALHDHHLNRPTLDDDDKDEEQQIEQQTAHITTLFHECQVAVQKISHYSNMTKGQQAKLSQNAASSLARELQELSLQFRQAQSTYLDKVKGREGRADAFFQRQQADVEQTFEEIDLYDEGFSKESLQLLQENTTEVQQREKEIQNIAQSIVDLNMIFKDLAVMIVDQGTVLDRIDYNIEQTHIHVEEGHKQLVKAESHQKKNRKLIVILILAGIIIVLLILLLTLKTK